MPKTEQDFKQTLSKVFLERIDKANERLKLGGVGVAIEAIGKRLYLVATLPPKPDAVKLKSHQQRIALGVLVNNATIQLAENEAKKVGGLLACKQFDWTPYLKGTAMKPTTVADWLTRFEAEFRETMEPVTWRTDYKNVFVKLPQNEPLTIELLRKVLAAERTQRPNSRTLRRCSLAFGRLAEFAGLEVNFKSFQGTYSANDVAPRDLPSDELIVECWQQIKNPGWQWIFGMLATFGLRDHEPFYLDVDELVKGKHLVVVMEGKTGKRLVWACYPEWIDQFNLRQKVLPKVTGKAHEDYTQRVCKFFGREVPFTALNLRHRWAVRTLEFGLPHELAAKQMGHSVAVHERTYHRWLTAETHQRAYDALMNRSDRPLPPQ